MVEPLGYNSPWEKFENEVYEIVKKYFTDFRPDFLDTEIIKYTQMYTHAECGGCGDRRAFGFDFEDCPYTSIKYLYQCNECGVVFNPDTNEIITNFEDIHADLMSDFPYYAQEFEKKISEFRRKMGIH